MNEDEVKTELREFSARCWENSREWNRLSLGPASMAMLNLGMMQVVFGLGHWGVGLILTVAFAFFVQLTWLGWRRAKVWRLRAEHLQRA